MRDHSHLAFPYPAIRISNDDYVDDFFETHPTIVIDNEKVNIALEYSLNSREINREITNGNASYASVISCRNTFFEKVLFSKQNYVDVDIDTFALRGKVEIRSYVLATKDVKVESEKINDEYLFIKDTNHVDHFADKSFDYEVGDMIALDSGNQFFIDKEYFKPLQGIFRLVLNKKLESGEWKIHSDDDKLLVNVSQDIHNIVKALSQNQIGKATLLNSIWFATLVHAVQLLKDNSELEKEYKWAEVVNAKIDLLGLSLDNDEAYEIATKLFSRPFGRLEALFEGEK